MLVDDAIYVPNLDSYTLSRYYGIKYMLNDDNIPVQTSWLKELFTYRDDDIFYEVPPEHIHRPDLIAQLLYGSDMYYWIIGYAEGMVDPIAETYLGRKMRLPSHDYVSQFVQE
jgi:hypothetical protein